VCAHTINDHKSLVFQFGFQWLGFGLLEVHTYVRFSARFQLHPRDIKPDFMFSPESEAGRGHCPAILAVGRPGKLKRYHHNLIVTIKADCTDHVVGNLIRWPCYLS